MAQRLGGLRRVLSSPRVYQGLQNLLGAQRLYRRLVDDHLALRPGQRLLDIGCGPAALLAHLPPGVEYLGFDESAPYIAAARRRFGDRGRFWAERVGAATLERIPPCDAVIAVGLLHHLDDGEAEALFQLAHAALQPGGRLVTYDPCYRDGQPRAARFVIARDRGQSVRSPEAYRDLARVAPFARVELKVLDHPLRIPYTATVLTCTRSTATDRAPVPPPAG